MTVLLSVLAFSSGCIAALLLYLASPQQQLRAAGPWPLRHGWLPGSVLALVSLAATWPLLAPVEAVSTWLVLLMLVWSVAPLLGAWRARVRAGRSA